MNFYDERFRETHQAEEVYITSVGQQMVSSFDSLEAVFLYHNNSNAELIPYCVVKNADEVRYQLLKTDTKPNLGSKAGVGDPKRCDFMLDTPKHLVFVELKDSPDPTKVANAVSQLISTYNDFKLAHPERLAATDGAPMAYIIACAKKVEKLRQATKVLMFSELAEAGLRFVQGNEILIQSIS